MQIQLESGQGFIISAYSDNSIRINNNEYSQNVLITPQELVSPWLTKPIHALTPDDLTPHLTDEIEILLIGHNQSVQLLPPELASFLANKRIGVECLTMGAACRTYSILNSESRRILAAFLFNEK